MNSLESGSYQKRKLRRHDRKAPDWRFDNARIREIVLSAFPKSEQSGKQRVQAGRWARVIYLYFQSGRSESEVAAVMGESVNAVHSLIRSINRVAKGLRANGTGKKVRIRAPFGYGRGRVNEGPLGTPKPAGVGKVLDSPVL